MAFRTVALLAQGVALCACQVAPATQKEPIGARTSDAAFLADMADAVLAPAPWAADRDSLDLYGRFVGAWSVDVVNYPEGAAPQHAQGEWLFSWALEGRAVLDTWIVPERSRRGPVHAGPQPYGTTLRFVDPATGRWQVVWVNPVSRNVSLMSAREVGGEIVQEGIDDDGLRYRWVFHAIERDRFLWRAEDTRDGSTWILRQSMTATRRQVAR